MQADFMPDDDGFQDIPWADEQPAHVDTRTREQQVYGMLTRVRMDLQQAALHLYRDYTARGVTPAEASEALGLPEKFLGALIEFGKRRLADVLWNDIESQRQHLAESTDYLAMKRRWMDGLEADNQEMILFPIERTIK